VKVSFARLHDLTAQNVSLKNLVNGHYNTSEPVSRETSQLKLPDIMPPFFSNHPSTNQLKTFVT